MSLGPIIPSSRLSKDKVVWSVDLAKSTTSDRVHGAGLKVNQNGPRDVLVARGRLIVVHLYPFLLKLVVTYVRKKTKEEVVNQPILYEKAEMKRMT